jgi:hypothetical protein
MPYATSPHTFVAAVKAAPTKIADLLQTYSNEAMSISTQQRESPGSGEAEQTAAQAAISAELAALQQTTLNDLQRLENLTAMALTEARDCLEMAILPEMSTDPHVQRVFELHQGKALARLRDLFGRARTEAAIADTVRQFATDAARQGDWAAIRVLRDETAPHLAARGIDPAVSEALRSIDEIVLAARPRSAEPLIQRRDLEQEASRVAAAFAQARDAVKPNEGEGQIPASEAAVLETGALPVAE